MTDLDDVQIGRLLSRRDVLVLFGASGTAAFLAACTPSALQSLAPTSSPTTAAGATASGSALPACVIEPALTEGPYFVDEKLLRSDIRPDPGSGAVSAGVLLNLVFAVSKVGGSSCQVYPDVLVDVWHCDALGHYSDIGSEGTLGQKFLRGYQVTDATGKASFTTIYPGWYQGRTVHIHFKIRSDPAASSGLEFTSQLFFDDTLSDRVFAQAPYSQKGQRFVRNNGDNIFQQSNGLLALAPSGDPANGFSATFEVGLQV